MIFQLLLNHKQSEFYTLELERGYSVNKAVQNCQELAQAIDLQPMNRKYKYKKLIELYGFLRMLLRRVLPLP